MPLFKKYYERTIRESDSSFDIQEAKEKLEKFFYPGYEDVMSSFRMATDLMEIMGEEKYYNINTWADLPFAPLAWHYFYGIGCEKNVEKAKQLIRWACFEDGTYCYPSWNKLIQDMGLDSELKYAEDEYKSNDEDSDVYK